ncbi:ABC transporter ATP-binding protein [Candidatus Gracilibacteria bacterium]|nr:ABC transporter ATP-binding protein [Candidatus Gracilibacteria bacterium]
MISLKNLSKSFISGEGHVTIFSNLHFTIEKGGFISIIGPSGSGKSTFLNLLSGIDTKYEGDISIDGTSMRDFTDTQITGFRGKNISYIFQNFKLIENLTVRENIDLIVDLNKLERNFSTEEILKIVGLESKIDTYVYNLSGGESQRVAIARAFVGKTKLLLADEPTGALDVNNKENIMNLIGKLHKKIGNTIVLITHDSDVAALAEKAYKVEGHGLKEITA